VGVVNRRIVLITGGGSVKEIRDDTEWFRKQRGDSGVPHYHRAVIGSACHARHAGSLENIKSLVRYSDEIPVESLVLEGKILCQIP
jgi:hypothetical protein